MIRDESRVSRAVRAAAAGEGRHKERNSDPGPPAEAFESVLELQREKRNP